jgi:large subunit ribosomal protein L28
MARKCFVTGKSTVFGRNVSHSKRKTNRRFMSNLHNFSFDSDILGRKISVRVSARGMKTIEHNMGIDQYLLKVSKSSLPSDLRILKKRIEKLSSAHVERKIAHVERKI